MGQRNNGRGAQSHSPESQIQICVILPRFFWIWNWNSHLYILFDILKDTNLKFGDPERGLQGVVRASLHRGSQADMQITATEELLSY